MPRRLKLHLFVSALLILFSFSYLWFKQYTLQTKLYFDDKGKFLYHENLYNRNIDATKNQVEQPQKRNYTTQLLSQNINTISEKEKDLANFIKRFKQKDIRSTIHPSSKLVHKSQAPEILFESIERANSSRFKLVVLVSSHASHVKRRKLIRKYWGNHSHWTSPYQWKIIFVTGFFSSSYKNQLHVEGNTYRDILIENIEGNFYKLSFKVMLGLKWVHGNLKYDFLLKCDDGVFVNIERLMKILSTTRHQYFGQKMERAVVQREGRYGVSKEEHPHPLYDPYCSGGGFVLGHLAVSKMIPFFNWVNPLKIDDAYIGKVVTRTGTKAMNYRGFIMYNHGCVFYSQLIASHPVEEKGCMKHLMHQCLVLNGKLKTDT